jgi:peroxin-19
MLDDFAQVQVNEPPAVKAPKAPEAGTSSKSAAVPELAEDNLLSDEDFAKQLQAGMANLLGEIETSVRLMFGVMTPGCVFHGF